MPVTIKSATMKYKNPTTGDYQGIDAIAETTTSEQVSAIESAGSDQITAIGNKGIETLASIPSDYTALSNEVDNIEDMIAPTEASSTASAAHAAGEYFIYSGVLYIATTDIASGATITPNTNCRAVPGGIGGEVSDLKSDLYQIMPENCNNSYTLNQYIAIPTSTAVGDVVSLTPTTATNMGYQIIDCAEGDYFDMRGRTTGGNCGYAFVDLNNKLVIAGSTIYYETFTAPSAGKLIVNINRNNNYHLYKGKNEVVQVRIDTGLQKANLNLTVSPGLWTRNGAGSSASSYRRTMDSVFFHAGTILKITAYCGTSGALLTEWDSNGTFIQTLIYTLNGTDETAAGAITYQFEKDAYVRFSYRNSDGITIEETLPSAETAYKKGSDNERGIANSLYEWERVLNSVCCIGDSLTKGAYYVNGHDGSSIEQNYPYFFGKQTGLTVQNEGLGGSSPSSRWTYFSTYDFTPYNAFFIWWGTNGGLTDTLAVDGVIDESGNLIADYTTYADTNTGDYCKVIGRIIQQVPHAKIFLATIYTTSGDLGTTNEVIGKIAALYPDNVMGIVDNNDGTLYTLASKKLTPSWVHIDNITHFSMVGNYYLAVHWIKAVRAIIAENPARFENLMEDILAQ